MPQNFIRGFFTIFWLLLKIYATLGDTGKFLHVSDFHYDWTYSLTGDTKSHCHDDGNHSEPVGTFGNYNCDSPWALVESAINNMVKICPNPDFILWTGDSIPHIPDSQYNLSIVVEVIRNITETLANKFPNSKLFAVLGNHDFNPANNLK